MTLLIDFVGMCCGVCALRESETAVPVVVSVVSDDLPEDKVGVSEVSVADDPRSGFVIIDAFWVGGYIEEVSELAVDFISGGCFLIRESAEAFDLVETFRSFSLTDTCESKSSKQSLNSFSKSLKSLNMLVLDIGLLCRLLTSSTCFSFRILGTGSGFSLNSSTLSASGDVSMFTTGTTY